MGATQHGTQATEAAQIDDAKHGQLAGFGPACASATPSQFPSRPAANVPWPARHACSWAATSRLAKRRTSPKGQLGESFRDRPSRS